jgi:HK97 family phage prohead protease
MSTTRPTAGAVETRTAPDLLTAEDRKIRGLIPYGIASRDMGGWTEIIEPTALANAALDDLVVTVDHAGVPLGRHPGTLTLENRDDGLHWSVTPPESRADVREAVERGDLRAGSWRMVVARDEWRGDVRHIHEISELRDVSVVTSPAYPAAAVEYRSAPEPDPVQAAPAATPTQENTMQTEDRHEAQEPAAGGLHVEDRTHTRPHRRLSAAFREGGFPAETATVEFGEFRAATFSSSMDLLNTSQQNGVNLGADQRYAWPVFPQVSVEAGATAVQVLHQASRTLPSAANVVRAIDAVTTKPEVASVLEVVTTPLKQVAAIESNIPNVYLEQPAFNSVIETDLRLALNEGLDKLVLDAVAASGFQAPSTDPLLISIRKAMTTLLASGYNPDTLVLTPANAEALDTLRATTTASEQYYVFAPGELAPRRLFGLNVRVSKTAAAPFVADSTALGKLYVAPIALARFEVDAGATNRSNVRLETNAVFGVERQAAAIRIAAS